MDARFITLATLTELLDEKQTKPAVLRSVVKELDIDLEKPNPMIS